MYIGVVAQPVVTSFKTFLLPRQPLALTPCTAILSDAPAVLYTTLILSPLLPLSINAPVGTVHRYVAALVVAETVYVAPVGVPTIGQILVVPVSVLGVEGMTCAAFDSF